MAAFMKTTQLLRLACFNREFVSHNNILQRNYRTFRRTPIKVHPPLNEYESSKSVEEYINAAVVTSLNQSKAKTKRNYIDQKPKLSETPVAEIGKDIAKYKPDIKYETVMKIDLKTKGLLTAAKSRKHRYEQQVFMVEGSRLVDEALIAGVHPKTILFSQRESLKKLKSLNSTPAQNLDGLPLVKAPYKQLKLWSSLTTCPGVMGVFSIPTSHPKLRPRLPLTVILDEIRDPKNLGGILRSLAAVGAEQVILTKGCCDPWDTKVLRAGCGAHFHLLIHTSVPWSTLSNYVNENYSIYIADVCRENWNTNNFNNINFSLIGAQNEKIREINEKGEEKIIDPSYDDESVLKKFKSVQFKSYIYDSVNYITSSKTYIALIIGGETGLSNSSKKFTLENGGVQVYIPLEHAESLNAGAATAVVVYEIHRQHRLSKDTSQFNISVNT
ncbi:rRNA methyltransferase 3, mitochondrial-like [Oratosquilla oratoria]|uniref:rRNA methyltransferase 3, mitochondrial-like n=1 Tax=Oratosquilla oratoria TaxID=337810 RepID=UPI003F774CDF